MNPQTDVQAQFSLPYTVAAAILRGRVSFEEFYPEVLHDPNIREMMKKIEVIHNPEFDPEFPKIWPARVTIRTTDGQALANRVDFPKGDVENPLSWEELIFRFEDHSQTVFDPSHQKRIVSILKELEDLDNINRLTALLGV